VEAGSCVAGERGYLCSRSVPCRSSCEMVSDAKVRLRVSLFSVVFDYLGGTMAVFMEMPL
jgi:hypothetical protein